MIIVDVALRYILSVTSSLSFELEWHLFAVLFLLTSAWTLREDKHVRVDVFYQHFSVKKKSWVNLMGSVMLLIPLCVVGLIEGTQFTMNSFAMGETSPDPGGLPARYLIKAAMPVGFLLLGLQGISEALKNFSTIISNER